MSPHSAPPQDSNPVAEQIREEERRRIAHDLHDELGSHLTAIKMALAQIQLPLPQSSTSICALQSQRDYANILIDGAINAMHDIIDDLHPAVLELGLAATLEWLSQSFSRQTGVVHHLHVDAAAANLPLTIFQTVSLYRIAREALHNAARHAAAQQLEIDLRLQDHQLLLTISDDGIGLPAAATLSAQASGLRGMQNRAAAIGASLTLDSARRRGTQLQVRLPMTVFVAPNLIK